MKTAKEKLIDLIEKEYSTNGFTTMFFSGTARENAERQVEGLIERATERAICDELERLNPTPKEHRGGLVCE